MTDIGVLALPALQDVQCVAMTNRKARCRNEVFDGPYWHWDEFATGAAVGFSSEAAFALHTQRCRVDRENMERASSVPVEWFEVIGADEK